MERVDVTVFGAFTSSMSDASLDVRGDSPTCQAVHESMHMSITLPHLNSGYLSLHPRAIHPSSFPSSSHPILPSPLSLTLAGKAPPLASLRIHRTIIILSIPPPHKLLPTIPLLFIPLLPLSLHISSAATFPEGISFYPSSPHHSSSIHIESLCCTFVVSGYICFIFFFFPS